MEDGENIFEKQAVSKSRTKVGKPPTRLQKHAPANLKLDEVTNPYASSSSGNVSIIPLLSPLIESPKALAEGEELKFPKSRNNNDIKCSGDEKKGGGGSSVAGERAVADPATMFSVFKSKCVIINDAQ
ncbi:uncharacterized protein LOC116111988 [Pistacia vera]|uniref:uncharacterized protein LOC116111988 n=1 Tax=Pistacia vera TaxID=55513 RepID=UPI0012635DEB|nr:uncharacterized protein LOC116111988 [Pistacia vera]